MEDVRFVRYVMEPNPDIQNTPPSYLPGEGEVMTYSGFYSEPQWKGIPPILVRWDLG